MSRELVIASKNAGKIREIRAIFADLPVAVVEVPTLPDVVEDGDSFRANAVKKAVEVARVTGRWALADDSGLEVDALDGGPGVLSARWAEVHSAGKGDADNNRVLLGQIDHVPDPQRTARFVCVLALSDPAGRIILTARDTVEGRIIREARGSNGFGYDPLFLIDVLGQTTEMWAGHNGTYVLVTPESAGSPAPLLTYMQQATATGYN